MGELNEYQEQALRTAGEKCRGSLPYSMGGVGGEAGEYIDVVKKHLFHDHPYAESRENALKELGDVLWGIAQAADAWGLTLSEVAAANVAKLKARYPDGFSTAASVAKADEKPRYARPPYLAQWQLGGCVVCGSADERSGNRYAHDSCWYETGAAQRLLMGEQCDSLARAVVEKTLLPDPRAPGHTWNDRPCSGCGDLDGCHLPHALGEAKR